MQDKWGREISYTQEDEGHVYQYGGYRLVLPERDDNLALDQLGMFNVPSIPQSP